MITFLIFTLLRKHIAQAWLKVGLLINQFLKTRFHILCTGFFLGVALIAPMMISAQNSQTHYKVLFNGEDVGWLRLERNNIGSKLNLSLISEIKMKVVFPIVVSTKELSTFENGKMIFSSQLRKTNGTTKVDKQTKLVGNAYQVFEDGETEKLSFPFINTNLLSLYFQEPTTLKTVYCDKRQGFVKITKTKDGGYQMKFSNGNSNCFYYKEGVCTKVKIEHLFYSAEIVFDH